MDTEKDTQATDGDAAEDTEGEGWHVNQAIPGDDKGDQKDDDQDDTEGHWNPVRQ